MPTVKMIYIKNPLYMGMFQLPHKILIDMKFTKPKPYKKLLSKREITNGKNITIKHTMKNIGKTIIPKGIVRFSCIRPTGIGKLTTTSAPIKIEALKPGETVDFRGENFFISPGLWLSNATLVINDKTKILYYREENEEPDEEKWELAFYVWDRHQLDLMLTLQKLLKIKEG